MHVFDDTLTLQGVGVFIFEDKYIYVYHSSLVTHSIAFFKADKQFIAIPVQGGYAVDGLASGIFANFVKLHELTAYGLHIWDDKPIFEVKI